jgi:predicted membrane channel-forming protein YqfA (hemolysin III family)
MLFSAFIFLGLGFFVLSLGANRTAKDSSTGAIALLLGVILFAISSGFFYLFFKEILPGLLGL